jgi:hypothetical protein
MWNLHGRLQDQFDTRCPLSTCANASGRLYRTQDRQTRVLLPVLDDIHPNQARRFYRIQGLPHQLP